ncbi:MAG: FGGY family carbohydrate kinase [Bacteroidia bacterium]
MYLLGFDIGSSSVKASLIEGASGKLIADAFSPETEMKIIAKHPDWAEQNPELWWENVKLATAKIISKAAINIDEIKAIGITYQMHGLVLVDKNYSVLRDAIIWCDSRASEIGRKAFASIGEEKCLEHFLNSPGNFTASKLRWVRENEPEVYERIYKFMLPGDYIAMKMSGTIQTTISGLSEMILWDYKKNDVADILLQHYDISKDLIPEIVPTFSIQSELNVSAAKELGLKSGTKITYRSGDQPNNAFSLNVLNPGEVATNAGTSGVIYGVTEEAKTDSKSRVNPFVHVNNSNENPRYGILLCINGTGILNNWLKEFLSITGDISYQKMNELAAQSPPGAQGLKFYPFGNGAERIFEDKNIGASLKDFHFNIHNPSYILRAAQEGIVFALNYGLDIMRAMEVKPKVIRAGETNMFLSPVFRQTFATLTGVVVELYDTDGSEGAARGAAVGFGFYSNFNEAFQNLKQTKAIEPDENLSQVYQDAYNNWLNHLNKILDAD